MNKTLKPIYLVFILLAFLATKVFCCCLIEGALAATKKAACSHCTTKTTKVDSNGCCLLKGAPMELVSIQDFNPSLILFAFIAFVFVYLKPRLRLSSFNLYINGPPGPYALVPLYIKARSIRI